MRSIQSSGPRKAASEVLDVMLSGSRPGLPHPLALEAAGSLAACMAETADKALVTQLVRTRAEGGKMPSTAILPPLGQVAARILAGDGTDAAAQWWLSQGQAREDAAQLAAWETDGGA